MSILVLRLGGPLQSWSGYRHQLNIRSSTPTEAMPRKSAISGIIGAALGPVDHGYGSARDLADIGERFALHVRVDTRNATTEDFQVLSPLGSAATRRADRAHKIGNASTEAFPTKRGKGNFDITVSRRDYLAHSEFVVGIETDDATAGAWLNALREPVFMPYLGRKSCAPTFPFLLGLHDGQAQDLFTNLPHVAKHAHHTTDDVAYLNGYEIVGDYGRHHAVEHAKSYQLNSVRRADQLTWAKENLR